MNDRVGDLLLRWLAHICFFWLVYDTRMNQIGCLGQLFLTERSDADANASPQ